MIEDKATIDTSGYCDETVWVSKDLQIIESKVHFNADNVTYYPTNQKNNNQCKNQQKMTDDRDSNIMFSKHFQTCGVKIE